MATSVADQRGTKIRTMVRPQSILTWLKSPGECSEPVSEANPETRSGPGADSNPLTIDDPVAHVAYDINNDIKPGGKEGVECEVASHGKKSRNVVMTLNNYTDVEVEALRIFGKKYCSYLVFGYEIAPTTGTPHLQIYAEFAEGKTYDTIKTQCFSRRYYIASRRGTAKQASAYCMYEDYPKCQKENKFEIFGDISKQGQRSEFDEVLAYAKAHTRQETIREFPYMFARMWLGLNSILDQFEEQYTPPPFAKLRKWQETLLSDFKQNPDDRTIVWVEDEKGGSGKSQFAQRYLMPQLGFLPLEGRLQDMAHIYNGEPGVIFDLARKQIEYVEHLLVFAEKLKDGKIVSTKYNGKVKRFRPPHVVFLSNDPPPIGQWTRDRLRHIVLDGSESTV